MNPVTPEIAGKKANAAGLIVCCRISQTDCLGIAPVVTKGQNKKPYLLFVPVSLNLDSQCLDQRDDIGVHYLRKMFPFVFRQRLAIQHFHLERQNEPIAMGILTIDEPGERTHLLKDGTLPGFAGSQEKQLDLLRLSLVVIGHLLLQILAQFIRLDLFGRL